MAGVSYYITLMTMAAPTCMQMMIYTITMKKTWCRKKPTITFPAVHSLANLGANGYNNKSTHKLGKQWKVSVRTKEQVTHAPAHIPQEPDVLFIKGNPVDPMPTKNSPGDLNYLPLSRTPTASATATTTKTCPTTVSICPTATISRPTVSHPKETTQSHSHPYTVPTSSITGCHTENRNAFSCGGPNARQRNRSPPSSTQYCS